MNAGLGDEDVEEGDDGAGVVVDSRGPTLQGLRPPSEGLGALRVPGAVGGGARASGAPQGLRPVSARR